MSYKRNSQENRDALFGPPTAKAPSGPKHKRENAANRDALFGGMENKKGPASKSTGKSSATASSSSRPKPSSTTAPAPAPVPSTSMGYSRDAKPKISSTLSGAAKMAKLKEAETLRDTATKAMQRGLFTRPDPITAANYYKRAADAYGLCGENRLERLHRVASADCQMGNGGFAAAAAEYLKAGALVKVSDEDIERRRKEGWKFYSDAANAWRQANEPGKAANAQVLGALAWTWEDDTTLLDRQALTSLEESIEAHVPDVLNEYARYRQTGVSKFVDPNKVHQKPSQETLTLAKEHIVKTPYAHEPLQQVCHTLVHYGEYQSALYACGAASTILENDGVSTLTLGRSYVMETILSLAMGDPIMAEKQFLNRHVQSTHYLTSRECKLAEDLYRAVLNRDADALDEARSPDGSNKNALANLHASMRMLVQNLRISGAARRRAPGSADGTKPKATGGSKKKSPPPPTPLQPPAPAIKDDDSSGSEEVKPSQNDGDNDDDLNPDKLASELDNVMAGMEELEGLGDDSDEDLDDDDIDLR